MINVEVSTVINRPIAEVFAFVANFENHPKWEMDFQKVQLLSSAPAARRSLRGLFRLLEPVMAGYIRKQNEKHLGNLKRLLEA